MKNNGITRITKAGMNIFSELGFPPAEATKLFAESNRLIAEKLSKSEVDAQVPGTSPRTIDHQSGTGKTASRD